VSFRVAGQCKQEFMRVNAFMPCSELHTLKYLYLQGLLLTLWNPPAYKIIHITTTRAFHWLMQECHSRHIDYTAISQRPQSRNFGCYGFQLSRPKASCFRTVNAFYRACDIAFPSAPLPTPVNDFITRYNSTLYCNVNNIFVLHESRWSSESFIELHYRNTLLTYLLSHLQITFYLGIKLRTPRDFRSPPPIWGLHL